MIISGERYEEQFTVFFDLLGFQDAIDAVEDVARLKILRLLQEVAALRRPFFIEKTGAERTRISPAISTFSDHIVLSFPLWPLKEQAGFDEDLIATLAVSHAVDIIATIAANALRIGFLVRGGATIGRLYHAPGIVYGEAMVEAFRLESRTAVYPRIVLSPEISRRGDWIRQSGVEQGHDGALHFDYFSRMLLQASHAGDHWASDATAWFRAVTQIIATQLQTLERVGKLHELMKWVWFAYEFRRGLERMNPRILEKFGISVTDVPCAHEHWKLMPGTRFAQR